MKPTDEILGAFRIAGWTAGSNLAVALLLERSNQHSQPAVLGLTLAAAGGVAILFGLVLAVAARLRAGAAPSLVSALAAWLGGPLAYVAATRLAALFGVGWLVLSAIMAIGLALLAAPDARRAPVGLRGPAAGFLLAMLIWLLRAEQVTRYTGPFIICVLVGVALLWESARPEAPRTRAALVAGTLAVLFGAPWLSTIQLRPQASDPRPSFVLVTIDALRADMIRPDLTPNLSRFVARATRYEHARTPAPWTRPAMASMLTGLSPLVHQAGLLNESIPATVPTLAELLSDAGYRTAAFVRNPHLTAGVGFDRGFQEYTRYPQTLGRSWADVPLRIARRAGYFPALVTDLLSRDALAWLEANRAAPYFLWIHYLDPHGPYAIPEHLRSGTPPAPGFDWNDSYAPPRASPESAEAEWFRHVYETEVRYVDEALGPLLAAVERAEGDRDQVVIVTADHGEALWEDGHFGHGRFDETVLRVPLAWRRSGQDGDTVRTPVTTRSIFASVLEAAGLPTDRSGIAPSLPSGSRQDVTLTEEYLASARVIDGDYVVAMIADGLKFIYQTSDDRSWIYTLDFGPQRELEKVDEQVRARFEALVGAIFTQAAETRARLRIELGESVEFDDDVLRDLRNLGYIQ